MNLSHVHWATTNSSGEWRAVIQDATGRTWNVTIEANPSGYGRTGLMIAMMICATAGVLKSNSRFATLAEAQSWCYTALGIAEEPLERPIEAALDR